MMGVAYKSILWNKNKKKYDRIILLLIVFLLATFIAFQLLFHPNITIETMIIRGSALTAIILLHIILLIGPLSRLDSRFLPVLYNRRHLGVSMFFLALIHGIFSIIQFHSLGDTNPIASVFLSNKNYQEISHFPFQILGFFALVILLFMAATSHDFWLKNLSPRIWKVLHMGVYIAYGLIIGHIALGTLQYESNPIYWVLLLSGFLLIAGLQIYTGLRENKKLVLDRNLPVDSGYYHVGTTASIDINCATSFFINGQNIAVFKYDGKVSAVSNICRHQMGPLGEGKIIDGCITCPWHGYQYLPENGQSPPPFNERLATFEVKIIDNEIWVNPSPNAPGTFVEPATFQSE